MVTVSGHWRDTTRYGGECVRDSLATATLIVTAYPARKAGVLSDQIVRLGENDKADSRPDRVIRYQLASRVALRCADLAVSASSLCLLTSTTRHRAPVLANLTGRLPR